jgi:hypothetical protein
VSGGDDLGGRLFAFEIKLEDRVHQIVRRKAILIELIRCELGRWFLFDDLVWNDLASRFFVDVPCDLPDSVFRTSPRTARPPFVSPYRVQ